MFRNLTLKQTSSVFVALLLLTGVAVEIGIRVAHNYIEKIEATWSTFEIERSEKARLETSLLASLGYGGMIFHFQDFVLRREAMHGNMAKESLLTAEVIVNQYLALGVTGVELAALEDIGATLNAYKKALQTATERAQKGESAFQIDTAVKVDDRLALRGLATLHNVNNDKRKSAAYSVGKSTLAARLRGNFGYGGFIHAFKNYVLRKEAADWNSAQIALAELLAIISEWRNIGATYGEAMALDDVERTLNLYAAQLVEAKQLVADRTPTEFIDRIVSVDDSLALRGLAILDQEIAAQIERQAQEVSENFRVVFQLEQILSWIVRGFIGVLILLSLLLIHRLIIAPIKGIASAMTRLAGGEFNVFVPGSKLGNEVGEMARAFEIFRDTAIKRKEIEESLEQSNEELSWQISELRDLRERSDEQAVMAVALAENLDMVRNEAEKATQRATADELRIRSILNTVDDAIITINTDGLIESFNPAAESIFGYKQDEVLNRNLSILMPEPHKSMHDDYLKAYNEGRPGRYLGQRVELSALRRDGSKFPIELAINAMQIPGETKFTGVIRDITERRKAEEEIRRLALSDPLTGLANRNRFHQKFEDALILAKRQKATIGLMMLDLDKFKLVNDTYGHPVGDALLKVVAEKLLENSRDTDTVARLGGDEFAIIAVDPEGRDALGIMAERIVESISAKTSILGNDLQIGTSIGIAYFPEHGETADNLIKRADKGLYAAKNAGRNTFRFFEQAMEDET